MSETYCGKSCMNCMHREQLNCPGCKMGPGRYMYGECEIAQCSMNKGLASCMTCFSLNGCGLVRECEQIPLKNKRKKEQEQALRMKFLQKKVFLGKWLGILFFAVILQIVCNAVLKFGSKNVSTEMYEITSYVEIFYYFFYGFIMFVLGKEEEHYRVAGCCSMLAGGISIFTMLFATNEIVAAMLTYIMIAKIVFTFIGEYSEFKAHSAVMENMHYGLSEKWKELWKFTVKMYVCIALCVAVMYVIPAVNALPLLISIIGLLVASIKKIVYLYHTANFCRI